MKKAISFKLNGQAVFDVCGARVNRMPVTPERILEALQKE